MKYFITIVILFLSYSCKDRYLGQPLSIRNNTNEQIFYWYSYWEQENFIRYHYPDTILPVMKPVFISSIDANNSETSGKADPNWVKIFSELSDGKFSVYFFKENINSQEEWDLVKQNNNFVRIDITYNEFVSNNYIIHYP